MKSHLYFVCPTDHLEPVIDVESEQRNFFYSSLGNTLVFNQDFASELGKLLLNRSIDSITFVLSNNNRIFLDAFYRQDYPEIKGMKSFYEDITHQKEQFRTMDIQVLDSELHILKRYLNLKVERLHDCLIDLGFDHLTIDASIFDASTRRFHKINLNANHNKADLAGHMRS